MDLVGRDWINPISRLIVSEWVGLTRMAGCLLGLLLDVVPDGAFERLPALLLETFLHRAAAAAAQPADQHIWTLCNNTDNTWIRIKKQSTFLSLQNTPSWVLVFLRYFVKPSSIFHFRWYIDLQISSRKLHISKTHSFHS